MLGSISETNFLAFSTFCSKFSSDKATFRMKSGKTAKVRSNFATCLQSRPQFGHLFGSFLRMLKYKLTLKVFILPFFLRVEAFDFVHIFVAADARYDCWTVSNQKCEHFDDLCM